MFRGLRNAFITGVVVILPLGVTVIVINFLLDRLGNPVSNFVFYFLDPDLRAVPIIDLALQVIAVLIVVLMITLVGWFTKFTIGRILLHSFENLLGRVPFINTVYLTVKQIVDTFSRQHKAVFQQVVLIEYPRPRCYALGFLTSRTRGEPQQKTGDNVVNIFVPTTPNPTSGFLLMLPETDVQHMDMSIGDGMKLIISGGAVVPPGNGSGEPVPISNPAAAEGSALR